MADFTANVLIDKPPPGHRLVTIVGRRLVGIFQIGDETRVWENICPHQGGPVCHGVLTGTLMPVASGSREIRWDHEGEVLACPWHGLEFSALSGKCLAWPEISLRSVPFEDRGRQIVVKAGSTLPSDLGATR